MKAKTKKATNRTIAVLDLETDPFLYGRTPRVFAGELYDGVSRWQFWGEHDDVITSLLQVCEDHGPFTVYAHNGGKFDYFYFLAHAEKSLNIINGRIVKMHIGECEFRDSYAIIPIPLGAYNKTQIDYAKFEDTEREKHKREILEYLHDDCKYLYELVSKFVERFGDKLTVGATAMSEMQKILKLSRTNESHDRVFREFYLGGRVQYFEAGAIKGDFKIYDVNSMYPHVMRAYRHPNGAGFVDSESTITPSGKLRDFPKAPMYFAKIKARNYGALPMRTENGLRFDVESGEFFATSHEIVAGLECDALKIDRVLECYVPSRYISFDAYVDKFVAEKVEAKKKGDKVNELFAKFLLNSAYGKFGQNPDNFYDYVIGGMARDRFAAGFEFFEQFEDLIIYRKPCPKPVYHDVATAASVTGAARAQLMRAIFNSTRPIYCDTDSLICEELHEPIDPYTLGAWKFEGAGDSVYIAGRKLYAVYSGAECIKLASKGAKLTGEQVKRICGGDVIKWKSDAPNFKLNGAAKFVDRKIRSVYDSFRG